MNIISTHISKAACLLACLLVASVQEVKAQQQPQSLTPEMLLPQFSNLSPEAASLGKFGAYSVSEYTGSPNIRIPLFTIQSGDISIPVELYYDASGIKVDQDATFVGLGWNLSYGGCISHIVCGEDDFKESPFSSASYFRNYYANIPTYIPQYFYPYQTSTSSIDDVVCEPLDYERYHLHDDLSKGYYTPDVFQASFCGQHVSFIIDKRNNNNIVILNNDPKKYKIEYVEGNYYPRYPGTIKITDDKGITYQFKPFREFDEADSYYLTNVYGPDGISGKNSITFEYKNYYNVVSSRPSIKSHESIGEMIDGNYPPDIFFQVMSVLGEHSNDINLSCGLHGFYGKVYPKKITTGTETIEFELQNRDDLRGDSAISVIQVKSGSTNLDRISFSYGYFDEQMPSSGLSTYTHKRLKLNSVMVNSKKYQMTYDESSLPAFASKSHDYWGYYNGANNSTLCGTPKYTLENDSVKTVKYLGNANRYASENLCKVGMLKSIIYPTGGRTDFEFEINRFNNEYYYPDAAQGQTSTISLTAEAVAIYEPQTKPKEFTLYQQTKCKFGAYLITSTSTKSVSTAILKNSSTGEVLKEFTASDGNILNETCDITLAKGKYIIEASASANSNGYAVIANCGISYTGFSIPNPNISLGQSKGGISMGGGLRIKSIKNYDSSSNSNTFLSGIEYEYRDGKLLKPTVRLEEHRIVYSYYGNPHPDLPGSGNMYDWLQADFTFSYANSEPSYLYACSMDVPATVGYSKVIKKEVDENGSVVRKTELDFHNYEYQMDHQVNQMVNNAIYYCSNGHLNGKLKKETIYYGNNTRQYIANYTYDDTELASVMYPKCIPLFFPSNMLAVLNYNVSLFHKHAMWCYLTKKNETFYDINGSNPWSKETRFTYDASNYQPSEQTVSDGFNTQKVKYWYPYTSGNQSKGLSYLTDKNCLSEVTGIDLYKNNKFTGGSRYDYTTDIKLPNNMPVVSKCLSIFPDNSTVLQMTVTGYDDSGNIREYKKMDGTPVTIIWSYNHQHPIMEIVGSTYANVEAKAATITSIENADSVSESEIRSLHTVLSTGLPNAYVTAYLYSPWHSVSHIIAPNGHETIYGYDSEGRLETVRDPLGVMQKYQYNYKIK